MLFPNVRDHGVLYTINFYVSIQQTRRQKVLDGITEFNLLLIYSRNKFWLVSVVPFGQCHIFKQCINLTLCLQFMSELYRPGDRFSAKLVPTFVDRGVLHSSCGRSPTAVISESNPDLWICSQELWPTGHRGSLKQCINCFDVMILPCILVIGHWHNFLCVQF
jgi:hypothetical protein